MARERAELTAIAGAAPGTAAGRAAHDSAWNDPNDVLSEGHTSAREGCPACAVLAHIEDEARQQGREEERERWLDVLQSHAYWSSDDVFPDPDCSCDEWNGKGSWVDHLLAILDAGELK